jgi:hypothetical protein
MRGRSLLVLVLTSLLAAPAAAEAPLTAGQQKAVVESLAKVVQAQYVYPEVGERTARRLLRSMDRGSYSQEQPDSLAEALTADLRAFTGDRHFRVGFQPDFQPSTQPDGEPSAADKALFRRSFARQNFGVGQATVLAGNVGLLDLRFFAPVEFSAPTITAAMAFLSSTDALILDVRQNDGGDPDTIAFLCSYLFKEGSRVHLNDLQYRARNELRQFWTQSTVAGPRHAGKPLYILTSARTFSGGEELAYDLQVLKRATVVGETTGGGANPGGAVMLANGFVAFVPMGRAVNPITRKNWEGVGVKPDVAVPAAQALAVAHAQALRTLLQAQTDQDYRKMLERLLAMVEKGERERPNYNRP